MLMNIVRNIELPLNVLTKGVPPILARVSEWQDHESKKALGTRYEIVCVGNAYEKVTVKVSAAPVITQAEIDNAPSPITVDFTGFSARIYEMSGNVDISAKADAILILDRKPSKQSAAQQQAQ